MLLDWNTLTPTFFTPRSPRRRPLDDLLRAFDPAVSTRSTAPTWPRVRVVEDDDAIHVTASVAGMGPDDVEITLHEGVLRIRGERRVAPPDGYRPVRTERASLQFDRAVRLPAEVDADAVTATVARGLLTVRLPKRPEAKRRVIPVRAD